MMIPKPINDPIAPIPVQTVYAVPKGNDRIEIDNNTTLKNPGKNKGHDTWRYVGKTFRHFIEYAQKYQNTCQN